MCGQVVVEELDIAEPSGLRVTKRSGIPALKRFVKTLRRYKYGILITLIIQYIRVSWRE
ncbi:MAG: hypothetical protein HPY70_09935 [Firmicutes bacterium]|nr:hypothetical protein [Bacillota bacterium]